jgi:hypothetical protein
VKGVWILYTFRLLRTDAALDASDRSCVVMTLFKTSLRDTILDCALLVFSVLAKHFYGDQIKAYETGGTCSTHEDMRNTYKNFSRKM